ncbi:MAG: V-type proton ATPase subunit E [Methanobacteriaceae archaeon]|nr:V-type proton ATPase subunit E [Methanobacteriaceae archaeon]
MSSGAEKIVENILSHSYTKADDIIKDAEEKANEIINEAKIEAQKTENEILEAAKKESDIKFQQIISGAKLNAKRNILRAREEIMEDTFQKAEKELKKIASAESEEYLDSLLRLIKEASLEIGGGSLEILMKDDDIPKIEKSLKTIETEVSEETGTKTTLKIGETINTIGGAIVKTTDGNVEVNNTIEARMERFRGVLRLEVAKVLFK